MGNNIQEMARNVAPLINDTATGKTRRTACRAGETAGDCAVRQVTTDNMRKSIENLLIQQGQINVDR
jgi:hypothetical protein